MNLQIDELLNALQLPEDKDWEFKAAKGGLPGSLWDSYSAMANTDGGMIVLGVKENQDGSFEIQGLDKPDTLQSQFWNHINNRNKVNLNLLQNSDVQVQFVENKALILIQVPRASRRQRPIYVGQNPIDGTYRRYRDGDYKCTPEEVARMLSDQSEETADCRILEGFSLDDLDSESIRQYRNRFSARDPNHVWLNEDVPGFLQKLGAWRRDRKTGEEGLTVAGLLMFGTDDALRSPEIGLKFQLDYRERISDSIADRWSDRLIPDGTWAPNLFQFFNKVYPKLVDGLKLPFAYQKNQPPHFADPIRTGMPPAHEAVQEALVNALIHADYKGQGGIVIERFSNRLELSNPGTLLVSIEQMMTGAVSECRNPLLQVMFRMIGAGDQAGSGIDKIRQGWYSQKLLSPSIQETQKPDRVKLLLPILSLFPKESLARLESVLGESVKKLSADEVQALVIADIEGHVSNQRIQQFSADHRSDITKKLQNLVSQHLLEKENYGRWASYRLDKRFQDDENSMRNAGNSVHKNGNSMRNGSVLENDVLLQIAAPARENPRLVPEITRKIIRELCENQPLTLVQIGNLMNRDPAGLRTRFIQEMVKDKELLPLHPEPNHPQQAYTTNSDWEKDD